MDQRIAVEVALEVINQNNVALIGTNNSHGNPNIKALIKIKNDGLNKFYFNTGIDSVKVGQMKRNKNGCVYFFDQMRHIGVMLEGEFNIINNVDIGISEIYQAMSINEYNLCTIEFITRRINVYKDYESKIWNV